MIVLAFCVAASVVLALAVLAILRVDQSLTRQARQCCRCLAAWSGLDKLCPQCQAKGRLARHGLIEPAPEYGHDWQGHLNTQPIPVVAK